MMRVRAKEYDCGECQSTLHQVPLKVVYSYATKASAGVAVVECVGVIECAVLDEVVS